MSDFTDFKYVEFAQFYFKKAVEDWFLSMIDAKILQRHTRIKKKPNRLQITIFTKIKILKFIINNLGIFAIFYIFCDFYSSLLCLNTTRFMNGDFICGKNRWLIKQKPNKFRRKVQNSRVIDEDTWFSNFEICLYD